MANQESPLQGQLSVQGESQDHAKEDVVNGGISALKDLDEATIRTVTGGVIPAREPYIPTLPTIPEYPHLEKLAVETQTILGHLVIDNHFK